MDRNRKNVETPESTLLNERLALAFAKRIAGAGVDVYFSIFTCKCLARSLLIDAAKISQSKAFVFRQGKRFAKEKDIIFSPQGAACPACGNRLGERVEHRMEFGASGLEINEIILHRDPVVIEAH